MATQKKEEKKADKQQPSIGKGVNSTDAEIKAMGGFAKVKSNLEALAALAKNAEQPKTLSI